MFLSGLEIDFLHLRKGRKTIPSEWQGSAQHVFCRTDYLFRHLYFIIASLSYAFVLAGFIQNAFLMTLIISTISLGVVVPTLKEERIMNSNIGQIILLVAVIADLATMILLAFFSSLYGEDSGNMWLLLILFAAGSCCISSAGSLNTVHLCSRCPKAPCRSAREPFSH